MPGESPAALLQCNLKCGGPREKADNYNGFGDGVSAFEPAESSRSQGAMTLSVILTRHSISETALVNKVAYFRKHVVIQFHAHEPRPKPIAQALFKLLKSVSGQVRLQPEQPQERLAVGSAIVVAGQAARRPNRQRERNCPRA